MRMLIVLVGLAALADLAVSYYPAYPYCCPHDLYTWCFTCYAPRDDCCIAIGFIKKCNAGETCAHYTDADGHSHRGCVPYDFCPETHVPCGEDEKSCKECLCDDAKFHTDVQDRNLSQCEGHGFEFPYFIASCYGDPHIKSCDGRYYSLCPVDCCHIFIRDNCKDGVPNGPPKFLVAIYLEPAATLKRGQVAKAVKIIYRDVYLYIDLNIGTFEDDGVQVNATAYPGIYNGTSYVVTFYEYLSILCIEFRNDDFRVYWDYYGGMSVWIPKIFKGQMCGLAGDCDENPKNDLRCGPSDDDGDCPWLGPTPPCKKGVILGEKKLFEFGMSWYNHNTRSKVCNDTCYQPHPVIV